MEICTKQLGNQSGEELKIDRFIRNITDCDPTHNVYGTLV